MRRTPFLALFSFVTPCLACGGEGGDTDDGGDDLADDTGSSETETGSGDPDSYGPCQGSSVCFENYEDPSCVEPADESAQGFCTEPCGSADECIVPSTGSPTVDCLDLSGMGPVCVLLCGGGCPQGMVCRYVGTNAGALDICFWPN